MSKRRPVQFRTILKSASEPHLELLDVETKIEENSCCSLSVPITPRGSDLNGPGRIVSVRGRALKSILEKRRISGGRGHNKMLSILTKSELDRSLTAKIQKDNEGLTYMYNSDFKNSLYGSALTNKSYLAL